MAADNLALRDEKAGHGKLPETFAKVRILPKMYVKTNHQTNKKKNKYQNPNPATSKPYLPKMVYAYNPCMKHTHTHHMPFTVHT